jgi:hypothetical protein
VATDCHVRFCKGDPIGFTKKNFLEVLAFSNALHVDSYLCVRTSAISGHEISASLYFKFTDCRYITESVRRTTMDPLLRGVSEAREGAMQAGLRTYLQDSSHSDSEWLNACNLINSENDIVVYGRIALSLSIDSHTKKICALSWEPQFTSVASVQ